MKYLCQDLNLRGTEICLKWFTLLPFLCILLLKSESIALGNNTLQNELTHVIWAFGQGGGKYDHKPKSGLEKGNAFIQDFYRPDEVKYHGKKNSGTQSL